MGISMALLDKNISGRSRIMQPSQSPSDRMLTALVLHVVTTILGKKKEPLVQPFVAILVNPQALKVSVYTYLQKWHQKCLSTCFALDNISFRYLLRYSTVHRVGFKVLG